MTSSIWNSRALASTLLEDVLDRRVHTRHIVGMDELPEDVADDFGRDQAERGLNGRADVGDGAETIDRGKDVAGACGNNLSENGPA